MPPPSELATELRAIVAKTQAERRAASIAAAVVRGGEVVWADAVGLADAEQSVDATPDHQYRVGSITKTFTAVCVMQLRDEGKLKLEDRLSAHLDVRAGGDLTLRQMLSHGSGLQREVPGDVWETLEFPKSTEELLATMEEAEQVLAPGERWHYSNLAYILLGELVAELSGMPYEDYVEQRLLQPLGLTRTSFSPEEPTAIAYSVEPYSDVLLREPMLVERTGGIAAAGQLWSTVGDLCRWASFLADPDPDVLSPASIDVMTAVQTMADPYHWTLAWGVGVALVRRDDRIYCGHDGGMPGYVANVLVDRSDKLGAAVLVNGETVTPVELALALVDKARERVPQEPETWRPTAPPPPELATALGRWWSEGSEFVFRWHDGRLEARMAEAAEWQPWTRFEPLDGDRLRTVFGRERGELLRLVRDAHGNVTRMYWATYPFSREPEVTGTRS
ncbi:MAG TPA: serine hydrolase domain-containing protein [Gaiellaceae bacterium]